MVAGVALCSSVTATSGGRALLPLGGVAIGRGNTSPVGKLPVLQLVALLSAGLGVGGVGRPLLGRGRRADLGLK